MDGLYSKLKKLEDRGIFPEDSALDDSSAIIEIDGIHYVNQKLLNTGSADTAGLDNDFKKLVDSLIK